MDARRLRYFLAIHDNASISRAAANLGMAQPALSQQLALLERDLGARLFDRTPTGVQATAAAERLYPHARALLTDLDQLSEVVRGPARAKVRIGLMASVAFGLGVDLIEAARRLDPPVDLQLIEDRNDVLSAMVEQGLLDFAIVAHRNAGHCEYETLAAEPLVYACSASWSVSDQVSMRELADAPLVLTARPHSVRTLVDCALDQAGINPQVVAEVNSLGVLIRAVSAGIGASFMHAPVLRGIAGVKVCRTEINISRTLLLCRRPTVSSVAVQRLLDETRALVRAWADAGTGA
jgi:DNA-binding transcriptional LysR family regulator